jgi:hypothetical protein
MLQRLLAIVTVSITLLGCGSSTQPPVETAGPLHPLNDTGTTFCRDFEGAAIDCAKAPGQDGNSGRDSQPLKKRGGGYAGFDFTKLDVQGKPLPIQDMAWNTGGDSASGERWFCVRDNHTGLVWESKNSDPGSLNHRDYLYVWHDPDTSKNGGFAGGASTTQCGGIPCDTRSFVDAMNAQRWCGINRWRLPTTAELLSLVVTDHLTLVADRNYFPDTQSSHYWTNQSYAPDNTKAWYVYLSDGSVASTLKSQPMYLRLVADQ